MPTEEITQDVTQTISQIFPGLGSLTLENVLYALVVLVVCALIIKLFLRAFDRATSRVKLDKGLQSFIRSALRVLLWFIVIMIVAGLLDIPTSSLLAVLSVAGLAISLSIQGTLSNLAAGVMLLLSKPFKVGDYVDAGGISGTVAEVGLIYTQVTTIDNKRIFVPNGEISSKQITNYSAESNRRVDLTFSTAYDAKPEAVKAAILAVANAHPKIMFSPEPFVGVMAYKESCVDYIVRLWTANADYWPVYFDLMEQVKAAFDAGGIEMTYNHLNVHLMPDRSGDKT